MNLAGQFVTMLVGGVAAAYADRALPEYTQQVAGVSITPGAIGAVAGLGALALFGSKVPARQLVATGVFGAALYEGMKVGEQQILPLLEGGATTAPPVGVPPAQAMPRFYNGVAGALPYGYGGAQQANQELAMMLQQFRRA